MTATGRLGSSTGLCDFVVRQQLSDLRPVSVVDFGAGKGKHGRIIRDVLGSACNVIAVEGYKPAAKALETQSLYSRVDCCLLQDWIQHDREPHSLAIFGDVIEHLAPREIHTALRACSKAFDYIIVVVPLHDIFQDAIDGNDLEIHRSYITKTFFDRYRPSQKHIVEGRHYTIMNVLIPTKRIENSALKRVTLQIAHYSLIILQTLRIARPAVDLAKWLRRRSFLQQFRR